ncbi:cell division protein FtsQ/DivIB [Candidatus Poriferisocius sp.]|uniref:cell division protein FtsQ/DivIB n=1 Tax=Candidatus Poriferisocius sp. TaxID=3101276 RepID=UPI003B01FA89
MPSDRTPGRPGGQPLPPLQAGNPPVDPQVEARQVANRRSEPPQVDPRIEARGHDVRSRRWLRLWITVGVVVALVAAAYGISQSALLDVDEVEVIGASRTGAGKVLEVAAVEPGTPLLGLDLSGPRTAIAALPWVDQVRSSRTWGGRVTFDITEREAVAQIPIDEAWALVDRRGRVLQVDADRGDLPVVLFSPVPEPGKWLREPSLPLLEVSEALIPLGGDGIGLIFLRNNQVIVDLLEAGEVHWGGRDDPFGKAAALATVLAKADLNCLEKVNLSVPELPVLTRHEDCS